VIAVVIAADLDACGALRAGDGVNFTLTLEAAAIAAAGE
jgi:hypothetical protein